MAPKRKQSKKPQESTRSTHDSRLGPSTRTVKKRAQPPRTEKKPENWLAEVIKAERCNSEGYKRWEWTTVFEYSQHERDARCYLRGTGGITNLVLTLFTDTGFPDTTSSKPTTVQTFPFPAHDAKISLRLYDSSALIELFTHPVKKRGQPVESGDFWAISLRGHNDYEKVQVGAMMRRVESLAREMPDLWFSYRNFFTIPGLATDTTIPPAPFASVGRYVHEMAGGNMTFTGNLARADILEGLGHRGYRPRLGESRMVTRAMARESNAYRYSTVLPAVKPPRKGKEKTPRLERLEARRAKRAGTEEYSEVEEAAEDEQKTGTQAEQSEPATALGESSESKDSPSEASSGEHPVKSILSDKVQKGVQMYRVEWEEQGRARSWVTEDQVSAEALSVYQQAKDDAQSKKKRKAPAKRGPGRPPKKGRKSKK
ncbi:MAG: hypothetical protein LQ346_004578 [Caloplaca aetnensis]|nr:MAG: hypothetical protein LQ346_004578 [Caloplaca aetnensis]